MTPVAIALGTNLGDRHRHLRDAATRLTGFLTSLRVSTFHDTEPVGVGPQPRFLNAAAVGECALPARDLLEALLAVEHAFGRERSYPGAPRTLDLDLILYGEAVIDAPGLVIPHPRFRQRRFVLAPLAEIAPEWTDPVTRLTVAKLLEQLADS